MIYKKYPGKPYYGYGKYRCFVELNEAMKAAGLVLYDAIELSRDTPLYFSYRQNGMTFL